jgi:hypothetical protein
VETDASTAATENRTVSVKARNAQVAVIEGNVKAGDAAVLPDAATSPREHVRGGLGLAARHRPTRGEGRWWSLAKGGSWAIRSQCSTWTERFSTR